MSRNIFYHLLHCDIISRQQADVSLKLDSALKAFFSAVN